MGIKLPDIVELFDLLARAQASDVDEDIASEKESFNRRVRREKQKLKWFEPDKRIIEFVRAVNSRSG